MRKPTANHINKPFMYKDFQEGFKLFQTALNRSCPYALLLGESGTGKTTLLRALGAELDRRRFHILYLSHGQPSPSTLVRVLAESMHLPLRRTRAETSRLLIQTLRNLPTRLLLWIDEAHTIRDDTLQEIRLLSEAKLEDPPLFSVLLSALPEIKDRLLSPQLFPLWRRISPKITLTGLCREEIIPFLTHTIGKQNIQRFSEQALSAIFEQARGVPALVHSFSVECLNANTNDQITADIVTEILDQFETK